MSVIKDYCNFATETLKQMEAKRDISLDGYNRYWNIVSGIHSGFKQAEKQFKGEAVKELRGKVCALVDSLEALELLLKLPSSPTEITPLTKEQLEDAAILKGIAGEMDKTRSREEMLRARKDYLHREIKKIEVELVNKHKVQNAYRGIQEHAKGEKPASKADALKLLSTFELANRGANTAQRDRAELEKKKQAFIAEAQGLEGDLQQAKRTMDYLKTRFDAEFHAIADPAVRRMYRASTVSPVAESLSQEKVKVAVKYNTGWGNALFVKGDFEGSDWKTGIPLQCKGTDEWSIELPKGCKFKILLNEQWETGEDRIANSEINLSGIAFQHAEKIKTTG